MTDEERYSIENVAWFAGLFEGEGSFTFNDGKPKALTIAMTDLDILERVQVIFGGSLREVSNPKRPQHHKICYVWNLNYLPASRVIPMILPYLGARRTKRAVEFLQLVEDRSYKKDQKREEFLDKVRKIRDLHATGTYTHREIATKLGMDRSHVSHILKGRNGV